MENILFIIYYIFIFSFGLIFGSFATMLIHRVKSKEEITLTGRSYCPKCKHTLGVFELIPLFSWLIQFGRCKHCKTKISNFYPLVELTMGISFIIGFSLSGIQHNIYTLIFLGVLISIYDYLTQEIPDLFNFLFIFLGLTLLGFSYFGINLLYEVNIIEHILYAIIIYTFFYLQFFIPGFIWCIKNKGNNKYIGLMLRDYFLFPFIAIYEMLSKKEVMKYPDELPTWIGGGDILLGIGFGLIGGYLGIHGIAWGYIFASVFGIGLMLVKRKRGIYIAFGPFLIAGFLFSFLTNTYIQTLFGI